MSQANDLISRSALLDEFRARKMTDAVPNYNRATVDVKDALYQYAQLTKGLLFAAPAVDAEPVRHGRWDAFGVRRKGAKGRTRIEYMFNACTLCENPAHARTAYCPNCGAKMDAEVEG